MNASCSFKVKKQRRHWMSEEAAVEYLAQWDMGDGGDIHDEPASGNSDDVYETDDGYRLSYNTGLGYIGLERLVE
jgi:hypothetical protein